MIEMARVKVKDAAERLGIPEQSLRLWVAQGTCTFGNVLIEMKSRRGRRTYYINGERLDRYLKGESIND